MKIQNLNLPSSWHIAKLDDIAIWGAGGTPKSTEPSYYGGNIPWLIIGDLNDGNVNDSMSKITELGLKNSSAKIVPPMSVLIAMYGSIGKLAINTIPVTTNQAIAFTEFLPSGIYNKYLFYYLYNIRSYLHSLGKGGTQKNISQTVLKPVPFPLAPIKEQHRIVAKIEQLFSELDKGIESLKTAQQQLKLYRQSLLKSAFEGKLTEQWRKDNTDKLETAEELLARIKEERENRYQQQIEEWEISVKGWESSGKEEKKPTKPKMLKDINFQTSDLHDFTKLDNNWIYCSLGNLIDDPKYGTSKKCSYDSGSTGVLRIPNIKLGLVDSHDLKYAEFDNNELSDYKLINGDILIIRSNGSISIVGKTARITDKEIDYIFAGYLIRLRPNLKLIHSKYLSYILQAHLLRKQIEYKAKSTSGVNNINSDEIKSLIIPIMSLDEQNNIIDELDKQLSVLASQEIEIKENIFRSEALRQSILKKAFSGKLVPQDPNDEPASELLKRIAIEKEKLKSSAKINKKRKKQ